MFWLAFSWLISPFSLSSKMVDGPNLFDMTESAINAFKKTETKKIIELKDKVKVGEEIKSHCNIKELADIVNQLLSKKEILNSL